MVYGKRQRIVRSLIVTFLGAIPAVGSFAGEKQVFSTWEGLEADKCASVWLIHRFIAPGTEVRFYPRGAITTEGIAFDTPNAQFRRYHNKATFETLIEHYRIEDEKLNHIARVIHDIEVNVWESKIMPETDKVSAEIQTIISREDNKQALMECSAYFDRWYDG